MESTTAPPQRQVTYRIQADDIEACSCKHGCNCQFGGYPNEGPCEFMLGINVREGAYGDIDLSGLRAVIAGKYPSAIHEGHGREVLFIDESATPEQVEALTTILTGEAGGMPWEALAETVESFEGPVLKPIEMKVDGRRSSFRIPGILEVNMTPLMDPVSGEEKEVHVVYPKGGFFWDDGDMTTTDAMWIDYKDIQLEYPGLYAAHAVAEWTNQA